MADGEGASYSSAEGVLVPGTVALTDWLAFARQAGRNYQTGSAGREGYAGCRAKGATFSDQRCSGLKRTHSSATSTQRARPRSRVHDVHACVSAYGFLHRLSPGGR